RGGADARVAPVLPDTRGRAPALPSGPLARDVRSVVLLPPQREPQLPRALARASEERVALGHELARPARGPRALRDEARPARDRHRRLAHGRFLRQRRGLPARRAGAPRTGAPRSLGRGRERGERGLLLL